MAWTQLTFGVHRGLTLPEIMFKDPDWFFWLYNDKQIVEDSQHTPKVRDEFKMVYLKARKIKIPRNELLGMEVRYYKSPTLEAESTEKGFATMEVCRRGETIFWEKEEDEYIRRDVIDFQMPWELKKRDTEGYERFLSKIRHWFFSLQYLDTPLAKEQCEAFFDNGDYFALTDEDADEFLHPYDP